MDALHITGEHVRRDTLALGAPPGRVDDRPLDVALRDIWTRDITAGLSRRLSFGLTRPVS